MKTIASLKDFYAIYIKNLPVWLTICWTRFCKKFGGKIPCPWSAPCCCCWPLDGAVLRLPVWVFALTLFAPTDPAADDIIHVLSWQLRTLEQTVTIYSHVYIFYFTFTFINNNAFCILQLTLVGSIVKISQRANALLHGINLNVKLLKRYGSLKLHFPYSWSSFTYYYPLVVSILSLVHLNM